MCSLPSLNTCINEPGFEGVETKSQHSNSKSSCTSITLPDCEFGVYDTSQLLKLIGITDHFLTLDVEVNKGIANKLLIADNEYNLEYALADTMLTPTVPSIDEPTYHMVADVNEEFIAKFLKAKKALAFSPEDERLQNNLKHYREKINEHS